MRIAHAIRCGVLAAAMTVLIGGCTASGVEDRNYPGLPEGVNRPDGDHLIMVEWSTEPQMLYLITYGARNCPVLPSAINWVDDATVDITVELHARPICNGDLTPRTSELTMAEYQGGELRVLVTGESTDETFDLPEQP